MQVSMFLDFFAALCKLIRLFLFVIKIQAYKILYKHFFKNAIFKFTHNILSRNRKIKQELLILTQNYIEEFPSQINCSKKTLKPLKDKNKKRIEYN